MIHEILALTVHSGYIHFFLEKNVDTLINSIKKPVRTFRL